jgi:hypothetical protein
MGEVYLVAVQHDDAGNLISQNLFPVIQRLVLPLLTKDSVLVLEGGRSRGKLNPGDSGYDLMYRQLGPIVLSGIRPVIHSDDAMYWLLPKDPLAWAREENEYADVVNSLFTFRTMPNTWDDLIATIKEDHHDAFVRECRAKTQDRVPVVIFATRSIDGTETEAVYEAGAMRCLLKPFTGEQFKKEVLPFIDVLWDR